MLPAQVVAWMLDDPRKIPYLLFWKSRSNGTAREVVRIAACNETNCPDALYWLAGVEIKRHDGTCNFIRTMLRRLPRNGGSVPLLICPYCDIPRRGLYGWEPGGQLTSGTVHSIWACRKCNMLRYSSEGGALLCRGRGTRLRSAPAARHAPTCGSLTYSPHLKRRRMEGGLAERKKKMEEIRKEQKNY
jgi:hypothetical protein